MKPKYKFVLLLLALQLPYFGFLGYFATQFPSSNVPEWYTDILLVWFTAIFLLVYFWGSGYSEVK